MKPRSAGHLERYATSRLQRQIDALGKQLLEVWTMLLSYMHCRHLYAVLLTVIVAAFSNHGTANDVFVGKFASLPMEFPPYPASEASSAEIYIVQKGDKYIVTEFAKGEFKLDYLAKRCDSKKDVSMPSLAGGKTDALCAAESGYAKFVYSQNGIDGRDPRISSLKGKRGESLLDASYLQAQYYVPPFLAFRRVDSFKYAPNDPIKLLARETPEFKALCRDVGVKLLKKPAAPVRSIAFDVDPKRISGWSGASRIEVDEDGRTLRFGGFSKRNSTEATKVARFEFTERRAGDGAGAATINPSAPYYRFPAAQQPYHGVNELSADVLAFLDVDKPDEYRKAPIKQGAIRYRITLTDRRSGAVLGVQTYAVDQLNHRACGVNVDNVISPSAFIFDAINQ
jgi:hypothetical protein